MRILAGSLAEVLYAMSDSGGPYFAWNWNMFLYTCLVVTTIYTFIGWLSKHTNLVEKSSKPQDMSDLNVFLLASHITFAILFTAQVFPYTYCAFHFYFTTYGLNDWTIPWSNSIMIFGVSSRLVLYVIEGSIRGVIRPFIFITAHHGLFFVFVITGFVTRSIFALKVMICIDLFASWEFVLFWTLVARKLKVNTTIVKALLFIGIGLYFLTRCLQFAVLASLFAYGYQPMSHTAHNRGVYWGFALMIICFHVIQTYTYVIYHNVWRSINRAAAREYEKRLAAKAGENAIPDAQAVTQV